MLQNNFPQKKLLQTSSTGPVQ